MKKVVEVGEKIILYVLRNSFLNSMQFVHPHFSPGIILNSARTREGLSIKIHDARRPLQKLNTEAYYVRQRENNRFF